MGAASKISSFRIQSNLLRYTNCFSVCKLIQVYGKRSKHLNKLWKSWFVLCFFWNSKLHTKFRTFKCNFSPKINKQMIHSSHQTRFPRLLSRSADDSRAQASDDSNAQWLVIAIEYSEALFFFGVVFKTFVLPTHLSWAYR